MDVIDAVVLGLVEGITEFLPVSSTGHLLVAQAMLGIGGTEASNSYAIVIQFGAILAVLKLYGSRVKQVLVSFKTKEKEGINLFACLMAAFLPAAVFGLAFDDKIEEVLFGPTPIVVAWIVGGFGILWWSKRQENRTGGRALEALHWRAAVAIGLFQCVALWPGVSRSLMTIVGGVTVGLSLAAAVEFSFLLGVITLSAASVYSGLKHFSSLAEFGPWLIVIGTFVSFVSAYAAARWMVSWINRNGLAIFGYWRILAGLIVGLMIYTKSI